MSMLLQDRLPRRWAAKWIDPELPHDKEQRQPASVLCRRFTADKTENAVLYITCHGLYEAVLNGQRVGDFVLAPGVDDYRKRLQVQAYDVTDLLRQGENELVVTLGCSWLLPGFPCQIPGGHRPWAADGLCLSGGMSCANGQSIR